MVTYYRYFWFQPDGHVRHLCSPSTPEVVKADPGGLWPPSGTRECLGKRVSVGRYYVRKGNQVHIVLPNISLDTNIVATVKIQDLRSVEGLRFGPPPLRPRPARGSFDTLVPVTFAIESPAFNGSTHRQPIPIPFGEKFHFHACNLSADSDTAVDHHLHRFAATTNEDGREEKNNGMSKHDEGILGATQLTAEEERKAAVEASL